MDYRELLLLRAARETGLLDAVAESAGTPAAVAGAAGVTERAARISLAALADVGLVSDAGDGYEPTDRLAGLLGEADDVDAMGSLPFRLDNLERWIALPETMARGEPPAVPENWTAHYVGAMADVDESTVRACVTAAVHERPDAGRVVDVGGGPGAFAEEFARRGFDVTLVDRPEAVDLVGPELAEGPVTAVGGDIREGLPGEFELAFCSRVAQALGPDENRRLLDAVRESLAPGGTLVLVELVRGRSPAAPLFGAHMLAQTEGGDTYTEAQYREWFTDAGFEAPRVAEVPDTPYQTVAAGLAEE